MPYCFWQTHRLHYRERGAGELLLILPGNTASSACHAGELDYFGQRYHAVSLDLLGTGQSDRLARWPASWWVDGASQVVALLDHLGGRRCTALGTSGGGIIALWLAIRFPEQVRAVVADSCVARLPPSALSSVADDRARRTPEQVAFWQFAHGDDWAQVVDADTALFTPYQTTGLDWFPAGELRQIACPVLLTASLADSLLPDVGVQTVAMARQIPGCRLLLVNGGDHPLLWSRPAEARAAVDTFLTTCTVPAPASDP
jgi:pimeloyl-ACP methyl ester carboxylesterase